MSSQTVPSPQARESLDGETIFAVGEDGDKWSDDEAQDGDQSGATNGKEPSKRLAG